RKLRLIDQHSLSEYDAVVMTATRAMADFFEATVAAGAPAKLAANWLMGDIQALLSEHKMEINEGRITPGNLADMIALIEDGTISGKIAKDVLVDMFE